MTRILRALLLLPLLLLAACSGPADDQPASTSQAAVVGKAVVQGVADVYRFAKISNGAYFFTGNTWEKDNILANYPDFRYEGVGFKRLSAGSGGVPVFRFANLGNGGYFYTASTWERDWVIQNRPDMRFEGSTFEVVDAQTPGAVPVLRLANLQNGAYLYTTSQFEVDAAVASGRWRNEGTAFHAPTAISCPAGSLPYQGQCACTTSGYEFDLASNSCYLPPTCPAGTTRQGPTCLCPNNGSFDTATNACLPACPSGLTRINGVCGCANNGYLDPNTNVCLPACPQDSARVGSTCVCNTVGYYYDTASSLCRQPICPPDAMRVGTTCSCNISGYVYDVATSSCRLPTNEFEFQVLSGRPSGCADNQDGCGGGADGSAGAAGDGSGASGADGKLTGAVVEVWRPFNGSLKLLGAVPVGPSSGMVTLRPGSYTGPVLLVFKGSRGGTYFDEALGATRPFEAGEELNVMIPTLAGVRRNYGATVLTDAAFRYALAQWGSATATREQNIAAILTAERINLANGLVLQVINSQLYLSSSALLLTDITKMPQVLGANTPASSLPDTPNGAYAVLLAALAKSAATFSGVASPGREFSRQFSLDLSDGVFDGRVGRSLLPGPRVYATPFDPPEIGLKLADTLPTAVTAMVNQYASPALIQTINPPAPPPTEPVVPPSSGPTLPSSCGPFVQVVNGSYYCCPTGTLGFATSPPLYCTLSTTGGIVPALGPF